MDKTLSYAKILASYLHEAAKDWPKNDQEELQVICDTTGNHYLLLWLGWSESGYTHSVPLHFDIKEGKIWVQENLTELEVGHDLVKKGIPKSDIVLGLQPPEYRAFTEYAAA